ncbi:Transcriptional regulator containing PAS, AAA-type ATPase, and DNA-binding Fis domains [Caloramator quimbayensis]|uniref:Transcriptional regulator containing PAS, AAA-type ATPase, and DNA-binding Fis domains n=1 Tax=Caloramator quimbayensis TaxID=1147123 RepID=A0A1T4XWV4_9CLOT|nr:sigma-54-dependent transcriptional regulator [Caloramator quimbayensis]SKA93688.1 Transcriptional regulator containing PAS, AAA-type ATPase, and DNA-binding Fis domains [Caloramator quimbayensis]
MPSKIRILAIAPYASMESLLIKLAEEYPNIDMTIAIGDLKKGVEIAQTNFHTNFDVIISRGGTAKLVQQFVSLPVIEIKTSAYDILRTLKLSGAGIRKVAVVGFSNITEELLSLKEMLPYNIDVFTINSTEEAIAILQQLKNAGYHAILCDMITYMTARGLGMNAFLITSGIESIRDAFNTAILYCSNYSHLRDENHFLRQLIQGRDSHTVVFTSDGKLFYSTVSEDDTIILDILHEKISQVPTKGKRRFLSRQNNLLYSIQAQRIVSNESEYVAFYFTVSKPPLAGNKCGINYYNYKEVENIYFNSTYSVMDSIAQIDNIIDQVNQNNYPVIILGEEGTGKEQIAKAIYLRSSMKNQPFIQIDCDLLSDKIWNYLLNHHNSPLCGAGNTIFIKSVNSLSEQQQKQLLIAITDMEICKRNRVIFSCISNSEGTFDSNAMTFVNRLHCFIITLPALRNDPSRIDSIVNLYLNRLNIDLAKQILGVSQDAMEMLRNFDWPFNYTQLSRVMRNLVIMVTEPYINSDDVQEALNKERTITAASIHAKDSTKPLDLSRPLSEINKEIVTMVLEAKNGNQSKAAESLGISRTTLWRLIKSQ